MHSKYLIVGSTIFLGVILLGIGIYTLNHGSSNAENKTDLNQNIPTVVQNKNSKILGSESKISHMTPSEFKSSIDSGEYILIDIRTIKEYDQGHIANASHSDFYKTQDFSSYLDSSDKNNKYLIYCRSGNRSGQALNIMKEKGFTNVSDLAGGFNSWTSNGYPIEY